MKQAHKLIGIFEQQLNRELKKRLAEANSFDKNQYNKELKDSVKRFERDFKRIFKSLPEERKIVQEKNGLEYYFKHNSLAAMIIPISKPKSSRVDNKTSARLIILSGRGINARLPMALDFDHPWDAIRNLMDMAKDYARD